MSKLKAALENVEQGRGFGVFEGLQKKGACTVAITFDGNDSLCCGCCGYVKCEA